MQIFPDAAIEEALKLTRDQNPAEATRLLLQRLSGGRMAPAAPPACADERGSATQRGEGPRPRMPLGETLARLRSGDFPGVSLGPEALANLRKRPNVHVPEGASWLSRDFACRAGSRRYKVYVPARSRRAKAPLVVMLHGCTQNPDDFAVGTGMNRLAEEHGFIVAYPEQPVTANQLGCWNWFNEKDQRRDAGEPGIIAGLTRSLIDDMGLDRERVFVAGLSAGGAMADVMSVTYPDLYAAAGVHSGLAYGVATDQASAFAAMSGMSLERRPLVTRQRSRTIVFHGRADTKVHPGNAERLATEARAHFGACEETTHRGMANGLQYERARVTDANGVLLEYWEIDGLGHAWCGGAPEGSHTDRRGPDASREMLRFFLEM